MAETKKTYPAPSHDEERDVLHILAACGFIGNETRTATAHAPINPPNMPRLFHDLRAYFRRLEASDAENAKKSKAAAGGK